MQFRSIRTLLRFWFIIVVVVPLVVLALILSIRESAAIKEREFDKLAAVRDLKVQQLATWLAETDRHIRLLSGYHRIRALEGLLGQAHQPEDAETISAAQALLERYVAESDDYTMISLVDAATGEVVISSSGTLVGQNVSHYEYVAVPLATRSPYTGGISYSERLHEPVMLFSTPILCLEHEDAHLISILVVQIDPSASLYELLLDPIGLGQSGEILILDKEGIALNELRWSDGAPFVLEISSEDAARARRGERGVIGTRDYRGVEVFAAFTHIPEVEWGFIVKQDRSEVFAPIRAMLIGTGVVFALLLSVAYLVAWRMSKSLASPVLSIAATMREMRAGNFAARSTVERSDEIGFLADSFNNMADIVVGQLAVKQGVARIIEVLASASDLQTDASTLTGALVETTGSNLAAVFLMNEDTREFDLLASVGGDHALLQAFDSRSLEALVGGKSAGNRIRHVKEISPDTPFQYKAFTGSMIPKELIMVPLVAAGELVGIVCLASLRSFTQESLEIINQAHAVMSASLAHQLAGDNIKQLAEEVTRTNAELEAQATELLQQAETLQEQGRKMEAQKTEVEQASHLKSEFLSHMSHELRTPLNAILALSGVLVRRRGQELLAKEVDYLKTIERNGNLLLRSIDGILDLSRIEAGAVDLHPTQLSLGSIIRAVVDSLEPLAEQKGLEINRKIPADLPKIESDETQIFHIIQNLVDNALKFTEEGNVTIAAASDAHEVHITVADTGIGIPEQDLHGVFEPFTQVTCRSSGEVGGIGLGLAIARKASVALAGRISVESTPGKGSSFCLSLPIAWKGSTIEQRTPDPRGSGIRRESGIENDDRQGKRELLILIVDDNPDDRIVLKALLERDYTTIEASDGEEGLRVALGELPDLILLDMALPKLDGFAIVRGIRGGKRASGIPVIAVTARAMKGDREKTLEAGCDDYVSKPVDERMLLAKIEALLHNRRTV